MIKQKARAKSLILNWFDRSGQPAELRDKLSSGIDRFFDEIIHRDAWLETMTILLGEGSVPSFRASGTLWRAIPYQEGLAVTTVVPGWGFGWRKNFKDEYVYDILSWMGHYARQYIHRSYVAKVLMIAWEREGIILHPFGSEGLSSRYGPVIPSISPKRAIAEAVAQSTTRWTAVQNAPCSRSGWTCRNTLDPAIHQAIFHFLRAQTLKSAGFDLEALVAFDCTVQSLQIINWVGTTGDPRRNRANLVAALGLKRSDESLANEIYFLRNEFAAHAGGWRWWDTGEYVDDYFMEKASDFTLRLLRRAAHAESRVRRINPEPVSWGAWLLESFPYLFGAIWFRDR